MTTTSSGWSSEKPVPCVHAGRSTEGDVCAVTVCFLLLTVLHSKIPHEEMVRKEELKRPCLKRCHPTQTTGCDLGVGCFAKEMMQRYAQKKSLILWIYFVSKLLLPLEIG